MTRQQVNKLDQAIKQLGRKGVKGKDMEKAIKAIMKDMGIKESNLDELSLSMKHITKTGINKNTGVDKDKLKMSLKDLRKKLDKKEDTKKPVHIVRSKKGTAQLHRISRQDNKVIRKEEVEKLDEVAPIVRAIGTAIKKVVTKKNKPAAPIIKNRGSTSSSNKGTNRVRTNKGSAVKKIVNNTARDRSKARRNELEKDRLRRQKDRERRQKMSRNTNAKV